MPQMHVLADLGADFWCITGAPVSTPSSQNYIALLLLGSFHSPVKRWGGGLVENFFYGTSRKV